MHIPIVRGNVTICEADDYSVFATPYAKFTVDGAGAALSAAGQYNSRNNAGVFEISQNGAAYSPVLLAPIGGVGVAHTLTAYMPDGIGWHVVLN